MTSKQVRKIVRCQAIIKQSIFIKTVRFLLPLLGLILVSNLLAACSGEVDSAPEENVITDPIVAEGETIFKQNCATCHAVTGETIVVGPSLAGIATRAGTRIEGVSATDYIQLSILRPGDYIVKGFSDLMPSNFGTTLSGEQLDALLTYLMTLE